MRSIRWKIVLMSLGLVFIPVYLLNDYAIRFFDRFTRAELESHLKHYAYIAGEEYRELAGRTDRSDIEPSANRFAARLARYGEEIGGQLQIVSTNGAVLFDSATPSSVGTSLQSRPEVVTALRGAYSARARLTPDRRFMYYYIARPIKTPRGDAVIGVSYVVRHTDPIIRAIQEMIANQKLATGIALAIAAAIAALLAQTLTSRLRRLTRAAREFAEGDARLDIKVGGRDEIGELGHAVRQMAAEIERRNRFNRDFVSTTMHELRSPLTAIRGAAELLEGGAGEDASARKKFLGNIRYEVDRMIRMSGELLDLTRLDVEMFRGQKEQVDYPAFVREVVERLEPSFDDAHAPLHLALAAEKIPVLIAPARVEQVISNLLENAFRYTPHDGKVEISVRRSDDGQSVLTAVSDTGRGIAPGDLEKVFDRFFTTEPKGQPRDYGSGLGLTIARTIVENHRGRIWARSPWPEQGPAATDAAPVNPAAAGTCILFTLPT